MCPETDVFQIELASSQRHANENYHDDIQNYPFYPQWGIAIVHVFDYSDS